MTDFKEVFSDEELAQINSVVTRFYQNTPVSAEEFRDTADLTIKAALNQLYGEQAARKQYILNTTVDAIDDNFTYEEYIKLLNLVKPGEKLSAKIGSITGVSVKNIEMSNELLQQINAYIIMDKQLNNYFVSKVELSISGIVKRVFYLSKEDIQKVEKATEFILQAPKTEMNLSQLAVPSYTADLINSLGLANEYAKSKTLGDKLKFIAQLRTAIFVVNQLRADGINDFNAILHATALCIYKTQSIHSSN